VDTDIFRTVLSPPQGLKCVGSEKRFVTYGSYKEDDHDTQGEAVKKETQS
jgi:hypothetical protein